MKCLKCNQEIKDDWNFCPKCGAVLYGRTKNIPFPDVVIMCYGRTTSLVIGGRQWFYGKKILFSHSIEENDGCPELQLDVDLVEPTLPPTVSDFWRKELDRVLRKQEHPQKGELQQWEPMEWRRFELLTDNAAERERLERLLRDHGLSRRELAIILFGLRVRPEFGKDHFCI